MFVIELKLFLPYIYFIEIITPCFKVNHSSTITITQVLDILWITCAKEETKFRNYPQESGHLIRRTRHASNCVWRVSPCKEVCPKKKENAKERLSASGVQKGLVEEVTLKLKLKGLKERWTGGLKGAFSRQRTFQGGQWGQNAQRVHQETGKAVCELACHAREFASSHAGTESMISENRKDMIQFRFPIYMKWG